MSRPKIEGGYILLSRKIIESEIWDKPPLYIKVWIYLLSRAQHKEYKKLKRGQLWTTIAEIQEACGWYVGFRREKPTRDQVYNIIEWMRTASKADETRFSYESNNEGDASTTMIATTRATRGMVVNIVNYNVYQDSKNYESNDEGNNEKVTKAIREQRGDDTINKNGKECKNDKNVSSIVNSENDFNNKSVTATASVEDLYLKITGKTANESDKAAIIDAVNKHGERHVVKVMNEVSKRGATINSFKYFLPAINEQKNKSGSKQRKIIKHNEASTDGENIEDILKRKQAEFLNNALEGLNERTRHTKSN